MVISEGMPRLLLVSNRLPVTVKVEHGTVSVSPSAGGLASGLRGPHESSQGLWIGWPGDTTKLSPRQREAVDVQLSQLRTVPLHLSASEVTRYYDGFSNRVLWPLLHYLLDRLPLTTNDWPSYRKVNQKFADAVVRSYQPGDTIWVHDYQLMLVPGMLREKLPDARIGFFHHIPFPALDVFRVLPWRREVVQGMLGADLLGFHTANYAQHFRDAAADLMGLPSDGESFTVGGRRVRVHHFPMGVDVEDFEARARTREVEDARIELLRSSVGEKIFVGIDRLDYTKGIRRRMLSIERLLQRQPSLRGKLRFIQVAVPSRTHVDTYATFRREVDEQVGRINGIYGTPASTPIHYLYRSISPTTLSALYRTADVMIVTPLRDGMNLVAKEFIASRVDGDGVLVLSEFAGAAAELEEALLVNPFDTDAVAKTLEHALGLAPEQRRSRMGALRTRVRDHDIHHWVDGFLDALEHPLPAPAAARPAGSVGSSSTELAALLTALNQAPQRLLILDYDGTLSPLVDRPELAVPSAELRRVLNSLADMGGSRVSVVSGRPRETLESWLGDLPIGLYAEHGLWGREAPGLPWRVRASVDRSWMAGIREVLEASARATVGTFVEQKDASLAWHYRLAAPDAAEPAREALLRELTTRLCGLPVSVLEGDKVVEVRPLGVHKGTVIPELTRNRIPGGLVLAAGDDRTDEDLFAALPPDGISLHVGPRPSRARYQLASPAALLRLLQALVDAHAETWAPSPS